MSNLARKLVDGFSKVLVHLVSLLVFVGLADGQPYFHGGAVFKTPLGPDGTQRAHVGDVITVAITFMNLDDFSDTITLTNVVDKVHHANNTSISTNLLAAPMILDSYLATGGTDTLEVTTAHFVLPGDENLKDSLLLDEAQAMGVDNHDGTNGNHIRQPFLLIFPGQIFVVRPCLQVTGSCAPGTNGTAIYIGSVSNCGNTTLTDVVVSNFFDGTFTKLLGPANLYTNELLTFTNIYRPNDPYQPSTNTLWAWGTDELGLRISGFAVATCGAVSVRPPLLVNPSQAANIFSLAFLSQTGVTYLLEAKGSLGGTNWIVSQTIPGTGKTLTVHESAIAATMHFYRLRIQ